MSRETNGLPRWNVALMVAHWKGKVPQLDHAIARAVMMCEGQEILTG